MDDQRDLPIPQPLPDSVEDAPVPAPVDGGIPPDAPVPEPLPDNGEANEAPIPIVYSADAAASQQPQGSWVHTPQGWVYRIPQAPQHPHYYQPYGPHFQSYSYHYQQYMRSRSPFLGVLTPWWGLLTGFVAVMSAFLLQAVVGFVWTVVAKATGHSFNVYDGAMLSTAMLVSVPAYIFMLKVMLDQRELEFGSSVALRSFRTRHVALALLFVALAIGLSSVIGHLIDYDKEPEFALKMLESKGSWVLLFIGMCLAPGIVEELVFRGVMFTGLRKKFGPMTVILITSALFGIIHIQYDWYGILCVALLGVALGTAREVSGSVVPSMIAHTLNNLFAFASVTMVEGAM